MLSLAAARNLIEQVVQPLEALSVPLPGAHGRILREDAVSPEDMPAFDRSAMDGYAIVANDNSPRFRVVAEVQAGQAPTARISQGECARIFTGALIPEGASQVIMQEDVDRDGEWMTIRERDTKMWIRYRGEDARRGDLLLAAGARLQAGELSLLAQIGVTHPRVGPAPRVLHFATGDELVDPSATPATGQIRDSNSTLVAALLAETGAQLVGQRRCGDSLEDLVREIKTQASETWDVLLISGGASVGDYDFGTRALSALGFEVQFDRMSIRPGKPLVFAKRGRQLAFVIPGNPVSHFVTFQLAIRFALERLEGAPPSWKLAKIALAEDLAAKPNERETLWPAHVVVSDDGLRVQPLNWQSSGDLRGLLGVNALIVIAPGEGGAKKAALVDCLLLARGF